MTVMQQEEKWVSLAEAVRLLGMTKPLFYRRLKHYGFEVRRTPYDERLRLVNLNEIKRTLGIK